MSDKIILGLQENLKLLNQKAIDADQLLDEFAKQGKGKFQAVINDQALFKAQAKRFQPYVYEVAENVANVEQADMQKASVQASLQLILRQMECLFTTLQALQNSLKAKQK